MAKPDPLLLDPARYPAHLELTTRFQDLDWNLHLNNVAIAALFEDARARYHWTMLGVREMMGADDRTMNASVTVDYITEMHYPAPVVAHVGVLSVGRTSWTLCGILEQEERIGAFMRATVVFTRNGTPSPLPDQLREALHGGQVRLDPPRL